MIVCVCEDEAFRCMEFVDRGSGFGPAFFEAEDDEDDLRGVRNCLGSWF